MANHRIFLLLLICVSTCSAAYNTPIARLEKDYDYDGGGESYYLKVWLNDTYHYVIWDDHWEEFQERDKEATFWCEKFDMTFGSPYTGTDHPGQVRFHMECGSAQALDECSVMENEFEDYMYHVRIQCMDPLSAFAKAQPLSGILTGVCAALGVLCLIFGCGCCCLLCTRNSKKNDTKPSSVGNTYTAQQPTTQQVQFQPQQPTTQQVQFQPQQPAPMQQTAPAMQQYPQPGAQVYPASNAYPPAPQLATAPPPPSYNQMYPPAAPVDNNQQKC